MAKRIVLLLIVLLLFAGFTNTGSCYDLKDKVHVYTLDNGLRILMLERHLSPTVACYIRYRAGAVDDRDGKTGMAHFLEHMMFKGTETIGTRDWSKEKPILLEVEKTGAALDHEILKGDKQKIADLRKKLDFLQKEEKAWIRENEIDELYTKNGAMNFNANTSQDMTTYLVSLPSNKIELWARIEADRMVHPVFREFFTERDVIMEERRQSIEANPEEKLYEQFIAQAFIAHPYHRPTIGWPSDMRFLDVASMRDFFLRFHAPNNTVIAMVGDIEPGATLQLLKKYFGSIPRQDIGSHPITDEPEQRGERRISLSYDARPQIILGYHKPPPPSKDDYVFDAIEAILSKGRTSRMYKSILEKQGLVESIQAMNGMPGARYPNLFSIWANPRGNHKTEEIEKAVYSELDKMKTEKVSKEELEKTINQMRADLIRGLKTNEGMANSLSYYEVLLGDYQYLIKYLDNMQKITPDDIQRVAKEYFQPENLTVAIINGTAGNREK
ncbi:MAG: pitrilysin family protein [Syntrophales bacterium]